MTDKKFINLNAVQTYLTAAMGAVATFTTVLLGLGCTAKLAGGIDCAASQYLSGPIANWLVQGTNLAIIGVVIIKLGILPAIQPGGWVANLFAPKAPITLTGTPGTVAPQDVVPK